jgi:hypothetical protein
MCNSRRIGRRKSEGIRESQYDTWKNLGKNCPCSVSPEALMNQIAEYLQNDLKLAQNITVEKQGHEYIKKNRGCYICHGKMVKDTYGIKPACAMFMFPVGALSENLKIRNVRLKEIRKPGPTGDCDWVYEIAN